MPLKHPKVPAASAESLSVPPLFTREGAEVPRHALPEEQLPPDVAYQLIHDELMLDGNARLNLATFVTTWMEPQAEKLMAECFDKNMIDKDEYPQTAEIEMRCVNMLSRLWHAPDADEATGCSTTGSSEAAMLGGLALKRRWQQRRKAAGRAHRPAEHRDGDQRPGLLGEVRQLLGRRDAPRADGGRPLPSLGGGGGRALRREHDRRRRDPRLDVRRLVRAGARRSATRSTPSRARRASTSPCTSTARRARSSRPFVDPDLVWDFRLPRVASINASGHKYGLVYPGVGWVVWRDAAALPEDLIFWVNYLGDNMPTFALNFSRPGAQVVAQYYNFLRLGFDGYRRVQGYAREVATRLSARIAELGPFELITKGDELPGVRVQAAGRRSRTTRSSTSRTRCASAAGRCPPTRSRRTARTSPRFASSSGAASPTTSPTCSSATSSASCRGCRSSRSRSTTARRQRASTTRGLMRIRRPSWGRSRPSQGGSASAAQAGGPGQGRRDGMAPRLGRHHGHG